MFKNHKIATMNKYISLAFAATMAALPVWAEGNEPENNAQPTSEFVSDEKLESGFVTSLINHSIENAMNTEATSQEKPKYGATLTDYVSAPKFGAYFIGKYAYSDKEGAHSGDGFSQRLIRAYVDGTILKDFSYRIQVQVNNASMHMKDYYLEWTKFKEFKIKVGQFKRAFTFENPMNPWDVEVGDYAQLTKKLAGMGDYCGEAAATGGRDQGIQVQGDLFPVGKDKHRLIHYQVALYNGQGINTGDANSTKDIIGTLQVQPIKNLFIGAFGWKGTYTSGTTTVDRIRYNLGVKYNYKNWTFRGEYAHSIGHKISDLQENGSWKGTGEADAWYVLVGIPFTSWLKLDLKYDAYRDQATWSSTKSIYQAAANIRLHKNLMFQIQYNYNHDRTLATGNKYNEIWVETYVRF